MHSANDEVGDTHAEIPEIIEYSACDAVDE